MQASLPLRPFRTFRTVAVQVGIGYTSAGSTGAHHSRSRSHSHLKRGSMDFPSTPTPRTAHSPQVGSGNMFWHPPMMPQGGSDTEVFWHIPLLAPASMNSLAQMGLVLVGCSKRGHQLVSSQHSRSLRLSLHRSYTIYLLLKYLS